MNNLRMDMNFNQIAIMFKEDRSQANFFLLYQRIKPIVMKYINYYVKDKETMENVFNDTMAIVHNKIDQYNPKYAVMTWIYTIARVESIWTIRIQNRTCSIDASISPEDSEEYVSSAVVKSVSTDFPEYEYYERAIGLDEKFDRVLSIMDKMPEAFKEIVVDRELCKLSMKELAEKHNLCENTVKTKLRCGRQWIKETYMKQYKDVESVSFLVPEEL